MSESEAPQSDAARRAAARRAKILARGNTGLQKLAQTARGDEADKLYGHDSVPSSRPETPSASESTAKLPLSDSSKPAGPGSSASVGGGSAPSWAPPPAGGQSTRPEMSAEQQQMAEQLQAMMSMLGGGGGGGGGFGGLGGGQGGEADMSRLFSQMLGGDVPTPSQRLLGDLDDPAGLGGDPDLGGLGGLGPFGPGAGMGFDPSQGFPSFPMMPQPQKGRGWVDKTFPLIHALAVVLLAAFVALWWEPNVRAAKWAGQVDAAWITRWGRLSGRRGLLDTAKVGLLGDIEALPIFWAFVTVELILQTTRILLLRSPPPPHSLIQTFLPLLPPGLSRPLVTGSRYLTLLAQTYKDGALFVFIIGALVVLGEFVASRGLLM